MISSYRGGGWLHVDHHPAGSFYSMGCVGQHKARSCDLRFRFGKQYVLNFVPLMHGICHMGATTNKSLI
jgi:hypothetical protein